MEEDVVLVQEKCALKIKEHHCACMRKKMGCICLLRERSSKCSEVVTVAESGWKIHRNYSCYSCKGRAKYLVSVAIRSE